MKIHSKEKKERFIKKEREQKPMVKSRVRESKKEEYTVCCQPFLLLPLTSECFCVSHYYFHVVTFCDGTCGSRFSIANSSNHGTGSCFYY